LHKQIQRRADDNAPGQAINAPPLSQYQDAENLPNLVDGSSQLRDKKNLVGVENTNHQSTQPEQHG
jgi:hypothetical protein